MGTEIIKSILCDCFFCLRSSGIGLCFVFFFVFSTEIEWCLEKTLTKEEKNDFIMNRVERANFG